MIPRRARLLQPGQMALASASKRQILRKKKAIAADPDPKVGLTNWLIGGVRAGVINTRSDVLGALQAVVEVFEIGDSHISIQLSSNSKKIELKGRIYAASFGESDAEDIRRAGRETVPALVDEPDLAAAEQARALLNERVESRAAYNRERYANAKSLGITKKEVDEYIKSTTEAARDVEETNQANADRPIQEPFQEVKNDGIGNPAYQGVGKAESALRIADQAIKRALRVADDAIERQLRDAGKEIDRTSGATELEAIECCNRVNAACRRIDDMVKAIALAGKDAREALVVDSDEEMPIFRDRQRSG